MYGGQQFFSGSGKTGWLPKPGVSESAFDCTDATIQACKLNRTQVLRIGNVGFIRFPRAGM